MGFWDLEEDDARKSKECYMPWLVTNLGGDMGGERWV